MSGDDFYPSVSYEFILGLLNSCVKVIDKIEVGATTAFVLAGTSPSHKRTLYLRKTGDEEIPFMKATAICYKIAKMGELLAWYEENKSWKDGAYFEKQIIPKKEEDND